MQPVCQWIVNFGGFYLLLGLGTVMVAAILLRDRDAHDALQCLVLFVCTVVLGTRIVWTVWAVAQPSVQDGSRFYLPDWHAIAQAKGLSLKTAWAFMALAGHFFITATGRLSRHWKGTSHKLAVVLCVMTMSAGLAGTWRGYARWHDWFGVELKRMAASCEANSRLTDKVTAQMALEMPDYWPVLEVRGRYLSDVGRFREARETFTQALIHVPEDQHDSRKCVMDEIERTAPAP